MQRYTGLIPLLPESHTMLGHIIVDTSVSRAVTSPDIYPDMITCCNSPNIQIYPLSNHRVTVIIQLSDSDNIDILDLFMNSCGLDSGLR